MNLPNPRARVYGHLRDAGFGLLMCLPLFVALWVVVGSF